MANEEIQRNREINDLYASSRFTYRDIAGFYGITRERVRQIVARPDSLPRWKPARRVYREKFVLENYTNLTIPQMAEALGMTLAGVSAILRYLGKKSPLRAPISYDVSNQNHRGFYWDERFAAEAEKRGMTIEIMPRHFAFDVLVNGKRVKVMSSSVRNEKYPNRYAFNPRSLVLKCDFAACVLIDIEAFFIIPVSALHTNHQTIGITWPNNYIAHPKYAEFHEAWDLLR